MKDVCRGVMLIGYSQLIPNLNLPSATIKGLRPLRVLCHGSDSARESYGYVAFGMNEFNRPSNFVPEATLWLMIAPLPPALRQQQHSRHNLPWLHSGPLQKDHQQARRRRKTGLKPLLILTVVSEGVFDCQRANAGHQTYQQWDL